MLSQFQTRFQSVEQSLTLLIDSISAYNPSIAAASALVTADNQLSTTISQLSTHHSNYTRILALRSTASALDEKIKSTLLTLSSTRKELLAIPSLQPAPSTREVTVDELLRYAKFISKTTVPPTYRRPLPENLLSMATTQPAAVPEELVDASSTTQITNGMATPSQSLETQQQQQTLLDTQAPDQEQQQQQQQQQPQENHAINSLPQSAKDQLNFESHLDFLPWPSHEAIRLGALASIQLMLEDGVDPTTVLSREEQEAEDKRKEEEVQRQKAEQEERERRRRESWAVGRGRVNRVEEDFDPDEL